MRYQIVMDIDVPRTKVIELFDDPDNMKAWQPDLVSFESLSGEPGQVGAKSRMRYDLGKRKVELIETITHRNLPDTFACTYETKGVWNQVENRFTEPDTNTTRWTFDNEFRFQGFMMRMMGFLLPGMFKKQSRLIMERFKAFAEHEWAASRG